MAQSRTAPIDRNAGAAADARPAAEIGPNAVTQVIAALTRAGHQRHAVPIFAAAGAADWLAAPPTTMVDERRVAQLHQAVRATLGPAEALAVLAGAGRLTADYILAVRIPRPAHAIMMRLPAGLAGRLLVSAIRAHAWTFAGSGRFSARAGTPTVLEISANPLCAGGRAAAPTCAWHAAVYQRLFEVLVSPAVRVAETACEACGDACCRFVVD
jgi:divinyl protochlorophyllide a 8-vinyl-reductase